MAQWPLPEVFDEAACQEKLYPTGGAKKGAPANKFALVSSHWENIIKGLKEPRGRCRAKKNSAPVLG